LLLETPADTIHGLSWKKNTLIFISCVALLRRSSNARIAVTLISATGPIENGVRKPEDSQTLGLESHPRGFPQWERARLLRKSWGGRIPKCLKTKNPIPWIVCNRNLGGRKNNFGNFGKIYFSV